MHTRSSGRRSTVLEIPGNSEVFLTSEGRSNGVDTSAKLYLVTHTPNIRGLANKVGTESPENSASLDT